MTPSLPFETRFPPLLLKPYLMLFYAFYLTHLDSYPALVDALGGINPIHVFLLAGLPFLAWFVLGEGSDLLLARSLAALHASLVPILFFFLWLVGHVLFLGGAVLSGHEDFTLYFPIYQLAVLLFGLFLAASPGAAAALRPAAATALIALAASVLVDAFFPGTFSVAAGRAAGFGLNANVAAFDLVMIASCAVRYGEPSRGDAALIGLAVIAVFFTFSRGGLLLTLLFLGVYASALLATGGVRPSKLVLPALGLGAAIAVAAWIFDHAAIVHLPGSAERLAWFTSASADKIEGNSRLELFRHYLGVVEQAPFRGGGTGTMLAEAARVPRSQGPHSMYLRVWLDHGLWGLTAYLGFLLSAAALFFARGAWAGVALMAVVIANGVFSHNITEDKTFILLLGAVLATSGLGEDAEAWP